MESLTFIDILMGVSSTKPLKNMPHAALDTVILLIKRKIILQREDKKVITVDEIISTIKEQIEIEKGQVKQIANIKSNGRVSAHYKIPYVLLNI